jgi:hypothetical protein
MKRKAALEEQARRTAKAASLAATALLQSLAAEKERLWDQVEEEEAEAEAEELLAEELLAKAEAEVFYQVWQEAEEEKAEAEAQLYYKVWEEAEEEEAAAEATELYWQRAEDAALGLSTSAEGTYDCFPL